MDPSFRMILIAGALLFALFAATIGSVSSHLDEPPTRTAYGVAH